MTRVSPAPVALAATLIATVLALCAGLPAAARAGQSAKIAASFAPERLGAATSVSVSFQIAAAGGGGELPSPLTGVDFRYPPNLAVATSGLGLASCGQAELELHGAAACPPNSIMGDGSATVEVPVGPELIVETAGIALVAGPSQDGYVRLLIVATGITPVAARIVMPTLLLAGHLQIAVPLVQGLPNGPDVSVVRARVTLGGDLTYYEHAHDRTRRYRPRGVGLPRTCPRGGFRFGATFTFLDGTQATATTSVRCPRRHAH